MPGTHSHIIELVPRAALLALPIALVACGGEPPKTAAAPPAAEEDESGYDNSGISASAEVGALDEDKVKKTFEGALDDVKACLHEGARRVELLGGGIAFYVEVDQSGEVIHAHAEESSLGDRATERCMIEAMRKQSWPPAQGGRKGLARSSYDFDMPNDVRAPTAWDGGAITDTVAQIEGDLMQCRSGTRGSHTATLYVDPEGAVIAAGIAASDPSGESAADCLVEALSKPTYPSPGSWPAKVSFMF